MKKSSFKENQDGNEAKNASLKVNCHVFSPASNWDSQPITPSPLHGGHGGWRVPNNNSSVNNNGLASSNEIGLQGTRIGYDGTAQTPSFQLLRPTASSLGHRVQKGSDSQVVLSSTSSFHSSRMDPTKYGVNAHDAADFNMPDHGGNRMDGGHMTTIAFDMSPLDPFGKLNRSSHSMAVASDDDEDMANMTQNSSDQMLDFELNDETTDEEGINGRRLHHLPGSGRDASTPPGRPHLPRAALHRCASWSPGSKTLHLRKDGYNAGLDNSERLRSHNMDPVASQLLRACVVHEEEQEEDRYVPFVSSHTIGRIRNPTGPFGGDDAALCHSPIPPSAESRNFTISASMPDLLSPCSSKRDRGGSKVTPMIAEETSINYPMSPVPLFRDVSGSLLDVKTEDDIKCLPRPVPRKFMPSVAASPSRRTSLPTHL